MALDNSIYVALSKQQAQYRQMDIIAHNVANANTVGYQSEHLMFDDYLEKTGNTPKDKISFTQDWGQYTDTSQGKAISTSNPFDLMINGDGYFVVTTPNGPRYTRAGNFQLDGTGALVTAQGYPVQGTGGATIQFQEEDKNIDIRADGTVLANGEERGKIQVVNFENKQLLDKVGNNNYTSDETPTPIESPTLAQGMLEGSNVEPIIELTTMIDTIRRVAATSQIIDNSYDLERKAVSTLSKQQR